MASAPRLRFAPSPTGYLHIGGARTALFNWLWAKKHAGQFVLRVEDTDRERSTEQSTRAVLDSLKWLGLDWDEGPEVGGSCGPYFQSERLSLYQQYANDLIDRGHAYRCFCSKEELQKARQQFAESGEKGAFRYPGTCRERSDEPDMPYVVRFKAPRTGKTAWDDRVKGRIEWANEDQQDFVLLRSGGMPLYNFGCVVDDLAMQISLVARGDDHMVNTPRQILLWQAFDHPAPQYAHLPMILAPNGEKLSKRHAAVSVLEYREMGYLPDAVLNYLARIGWSHGDQEVFERDELIEKFGWDHVGRTAGRYNASKFAFVQAEHLRKLPDAELAERVKPFLLQRGLEVGADDPTLLAALPLVKPRSTTLHDVAEHVDFFVRPEPVFDPKARRKFLTPDSAALLSELRQKVAEQEGFSKEALEHAVKSWLEQADISLKKIAQPARVALTGRTKSPGLFEVMEILGKQPTLQRLDRGAQLARSATDETSAAS